MTDNQALQQSVNDFFHQEMHQHCQVLRAQVSDNTIDDDEPATNLTHTLGILSSAAKLAGMDKAVSLIASMRELALPGSTGFREHCDQWKRSIDALLALADAPEPTDPGHDAAIRRINQCMEFNQPATHTGQADTEETQEPVVANTSPFCEHTPENRDPAMLELYRIECQRHGEQLVNKLGEAENTPLDTDSIKAMLKACQSIRSAALLVYDQTLADTASELQERLHSHIHQDGNIPEKLLSEYRKISMRLTRADDQTSESGTVTPASVPGCETEPEPEPVKTDKPVQQQTTQTNSKPTTQPEDNTDIELPETPLFEITSQIDESILDLFRIEIETHSEALSDDLLILEKNHEDKQVLEKLMRTSHSIKGAARMVGANAAVGLAHAMEDYFVAVQEGRADIQVSSIDILLASLDNINHISRIPAAAMCSWPEEHRETLSQLIYRLQLAAEGSQVSAIVTPVKTGTKQKILSPLSEPPGKEEPQNNFVRINAEHLDTMMGLSGELLVGSRWIGQHADELINLKRQHNHLIKQLGQIRDTLNEQLVSEDALESFQSLEQQAESCRTILSERLNDVEDFDRRNHGLTDRLNHEVIAGRMRPFGEGIQGFTRMVRDLAQNLGKQVDLIIDGENTQVDRDILERIEAPLNHMLRNAIDHGIEKPSERVQAGKPETGTIRLRAYHNAGMLSIDIIDDGKGIDVEALRNRIVERDMITAHVSEELSESELLDFLYLPGFSTRDDVTDISGRGVGLDVVHSTIQELRGQIHSSSTVGEGLRIHLQLPLTLSVIRTLLVELDQETYAFPMTRIDHIIKVSPGEIESLAGKQYIRVQNQTAGLVHGAQILGLKQLSTDAPEIPVIIISDRNHSYGVVVERLIGERELAIHSLDERLGKIRDISAAAILEDGTPTLIVDIDDMLRSIEKLSSTSALHAVTRTDQPATEQQAIKRILVVDDSLTVREAERKMIEARGYQVEVAVDGMDGWNTLREGEFDLVVSDIDMPRMNGIEFISQIKQEEAYQDIPVMIVSYKDREEDRMLGLEAGADYYLTKGSFHDESLIDAIYDLIGPA